MIKDSSLLSSPSLSFHLFPFPLFPLLHFLFSLPLRSTPLIWLRDLEKRIAPSGSGWNPVVISIWCILVINFYLFSTRFIIYITRLCYDASVRLSVHLSVTFLHCGHRVQWIPDIFACLDRWMSLLFATYWQRLTQIIGCDDARISGGRGGYGEIGNCSDITFKIYLLRVWTGNCNVVIVYIWTMLIFNLIL